MPQNDSSSQILSISPFWFNTTDIPNGAVAAHVAFEILSEHEPSYLDDVDRQFWGRWAVLLIWYPFGGAKLRFAIIQRLFSVATDDAEAAVMKILASDLTNAAQAIRRTAIFWTSRLQLQVVDLLKKENFSQPWASVAVHELLVLRNQELADEANRILQRHDEREIALTLVIELLNTSRGNLWSSVWSAVSSGTTYGDKLLRALISNEDLAYLSGLNSRQLADYFVLVMKRFPRSDDPVHSGVFTPGLGDPVIQLRSALVSNLETMGNEGVAMLKRCRRELKDEMWLDWSIQRARSNALRAGWKPLAPQQILDTVRASDPAWRTLVSNEYASWLSSFVFCIAGALFTRNQSIEQQVAVGINIGLTTLSISVGLRKILPDWFTLLLVGTISFAITTLMFWSTWR